MIKTILFATDLGFNMHHLLHHVNDLAGQHHAKVIVVHAVEPAGHIGSAVVEAYLSDDNQRDYNEFGISSIIAGIKSRIVEVLEDEYIDGQRGLANIRDVRVIKGKPADVILEQALACSADMIVLGSHGRDSDKLNLLGSVTSRVLQTSRTPIYMIPLARNAMPEVNAC